MLCIIDDFHVGYFHTDVILLILAANSKNDHFLLRDFSCRPYGELFHSRDDRTRFLDLSCVFRDPLLLIVSSLGLTAMTSQIDGTVF